MESARRRVAVVEYDARWKLAFETEARRLERALGGLVRGLHHIGSTSVPGLCAKPIIDILLEVEAIARLDQSPSSLESLGYEAKGEHGIPGRRYFRRDDATGVRAHHLHAFAAGSEQVRWNLAFRDFLIANPTEARRYGELKRRLAAEHPHDIDAYMAGKAPFIEALRQRAMARWSARCDH